MGRPCSAPGLPSTAHAREAGVIQDNKDEAEIAIAADIEDDLDVGDILTLAGRAPEGLPLLPADLAQGADLCALGELLTVDAWGDIAGKEGCADGAVVDQVVLEPVVVRANPGDGLAELPCAVGLRQRGYDAVGLGTGQLAAELSSLTKDPRGTVVVVVEAGVDKDLGFDTDLSGRGCGGGAGDG